MHDTKYPVRSYNIYVHRSKSGALKKGEKNLNKANWENALLASIGKSPSNGHHMCTHMVKLNFEMELCSKMG